MESFERKFLKVDELAKTLKCSRTKAYEMVRTGEIPTVIIAGLLRIPAAALDRIAQRAIDDAESAKRSA